MARGKKGRVNDVSDMGAMQKIGLRRSIRGKLLLMVIASVLVTNMVLVLMMVPYFAKNITKETQNYMYDLAVSNGTILSGMIPDPGHEDELTYAMLNNRFAEVGVKGIESSHVSIVNNKGICIYDPDQSSVGSQMEIEGIQDVLNQMKSGTIPQPGVVEDMVDGNKQYMSYAVTQSGDAMIIIHTDEDEMLRSVSVITSVCIVILIILLLIAVVVAWVSTGMVVRPIKRLAELITKMSDMDFTTNEDAGKLVSCKDEIGLMSRSVARLRIGLSEVMDELQKQSQELFQASDRLDNNAQNTSTTIGQVENAVDDIAKGASSQATETQAATGHILTMGQMIEETNQQVDNLKDNAEKMKESSDTAQKTLSELMEVNVVTKDSIDEIYEQTNTTNESANKIKAATDLITSIAEETNLLSLNASIEAARAGEQGRGFAVVAAQIQKLAEQCNESAVQIQNITDMLIQDSTKAVDTMEVVKDNMNMQNDKMVQTDKMFEVVSAGVNDSLESIEMIVDKTDRLGESRGKVVDVVQSLSAIAEENAASSEETSASVTQVTQIVVDVSDNANHLKEIASNLDESIKRFKL